MFENILNKIYSNEDDNQEQLQQQNNSNSNDENLKEKDTEFEKKDSQDLINVQLQINNNNEEDDALSTNSLNLSSSTGSLSRSTSSLSSSNGINKSINNLNNNNNNNSHNNNNNVYKCPYQYDYSIGSFRTMKEDSILYLFSFMDIVSICRLSQVSKSFAQILKNDLIWTVLYSRDFKNSKTIILDKLTKGIQGHKFLYKSVYLDEKNLTLTKPSLKTSLIKTFSSIPKIFKRKESKILMFGLNDSGKTAILYKLHSSEFVMTSPTDGFNVESVPYKDNDLIIFDIGFSNKNVEQVVSYFRENTKAIVFTIDSTNPSSFNKSKQFLDSVLSNTALSKLPLLIYCTKQDSPQSVSTKDIAESLDLSRFYNQRDWKIQSCSSKSGDGLYEGINFLCESFSKNQE
eukprot:gene896-1121_t